MDQLITLKICVRLFFKRSETRIFIAFLKAVLKNKLGPVNNYLKPPNLDQLITPQQIYIYIYIYIYICGTFRVYVAIFGVFWVKLRKQLVLQCFEAASNV